MGSPQTNADFPFPATSAASHYPRAALIRLPMLLQWTGSPFPLERGCPGKTSKINGFWELVLCLCCRKIGALVRSSGISA